MSVNPPHLTDQPIVAQMRRIGMEPGKPLDWSKLDPAVRTALEQASKDALLRIRSSYGQTSRKSNGWAFRSEGNGVFGNSYLVRAGVAMFGLGTNPPEDAIYPNRGTDDDGKPLTGEHVYEVRFEKDQLPPVGAFWSLTLYDKDGFAVENPLKRYAIGDRDSLTFSEEGSLTLYIQSTSPGKDKESNWLPAPQGPFVLQMRLYWPKAEALDGRWEMPKLVRVP
jgi:hypothetical protein